MKTSSVLAVLALVALAAGTRADGESFSSKSCEIAAAALDPVEFVNRALGGSKDCVNFEDKSTCCDTIQGLFGGEGAVPNCLCDKEFYSSLVYGLPAANGIQAESYLNMIKGCNLPVAGRLSCPGATEEGSSDPLVQSQLLGSLLLAKVLSSGSSPAAAPAPAPKPPAPKPKAPMPTYPSSHHHAGAGKAYKVVTVAPAPAPVVVAPAPAPVPQTVVVEEPAVAPTVMPKVTGPSIMPKATAPAIKPSQPSQPTPPNKAPEVPEEVPEVPVEVPEVPVEVPEVPEEVPEVPEEVPEVPEEVPEVPEEVPEVPEEVPEVPEEVPEVPEEVPEVPEEVPEVPEEVPEVPEEVPEVPEEVPEVKGGTETAETSVTADVSGDATADGEASATAEEGTAEADARLTITTTGGKASGEASATASSTDCSTVAELVTENADLSILLQLVESTGLTGSFGQDFSGTVFAPNNAAFESLLAELGLDISVLLDSRSKDLVTKILQLHVIPGTVAKAADLSDNQTLSTLLGGDESLTVSTSGGVKVKGPGNAEGVNVVAPDVEACGGVVHVLDGVLVPSPKITALSGIDFSYLLG